MHEPFLLNKQALYCFYRTERDKPGLTMTNLLLRIRYWSFAYYEASEGRSYALRNYKLSFWALMSLYYLVPCSALAELSYKVNWRPMFMPHPTSNLLDKLLFGILLFTPYSLFVPWFLQKAQQIEPIESLTTHPGGKPGLKLLLVFLAGVSLLALVPFSLDRLLPNYNR